MNDPIQSQPPAISGQPEGEAAHTFPILEEIPYETNDKAGGYYLHFSEEGDSLYISKAGNTPEAFAELAKAVRACKSHAALVDIARRLSLLCPSSEGLGGHAPIGAFSILADAARAALAKVTRTQ